MSSRFLQFTLLEWGYFVGSFSAIAFLLRRKFVKNVLEKYAIGPICQICSKKHTASSDERVRKTGPLAFLEALRVISLFAVMTGHIRQILSNFYDERVGDTGYYTPFSWFIIQAMNISVETFLFLGGLLHAHTWKRRYETPLPPASATQQPQDSTAPDSLSIMLTKMAAQRWLRLVPSLMSVVLISIVWAHFVPITLWMGSSDSTYGCQNTWWTMVLLVNNYAPNSCLRWTWYLALDFQLYLLAPLLLICMHKFPVNKIMTALSAMILFTSVWRGAIAYFYAFDVLYVADAPVWEAAMQWIYVKPIPRVAPYLLGMIIGYYRVELQSFYNRQISKHHLRILNGVAVLMGFWGFFGGFAFVTDPLHSLLKLSPSSCLYHFYRVLYIGNFRLAFSIAVSAFSLSCLYRETLKQSLTHPLWTSVSRFSYGTYLIHPLIAGAILHTANLLTVPVTQYLPVDVLLCLLTPTVAGISLFLASLLHKYVEMPAMKLRYLIQ